MSTPETATSQVWAAPLCLGKGALTHSCLFQKVLLAIWGSLQYLSLSSASPPSPLLLVYTPTHWHNYKISPYI